VSYRAIVGGYTRSAGAVIGTLACFAAVIGGRQSSVTAAVQDCRDEPSGLPVNGSKYSLRSPAAAIWLSESRRISSARAE
jgi:hypothetical protein